MSSTSNKAGRRCPKRLCASFLICTFATVSAWAYPIRPLSLDELISKSELIVVADVKGSATNEEQRTYRTLKVATIVSGTVDSGIIQAQEYPGLGCPLPPHFVKGDRVLVFLSNGQEHRYDVVGLSYGVRSLARDHQDEAIEFIRRHLEVNAIRDDEERQAARMKLFLDEITSVVFRVDGAAAILSNNLVASLTDEQTKVVTELARNAKEGNEEIVLLRILEEKKSPEFVNLLLERLEGARALETGYIGSYMLGLERACGTDLGVRRLFTHDRWRTLDAEGRRAYIDRVVKAYHKAVANRTRFARKK